MHTAYVAALAELPRYLPGHGYVTAGVSALRSRIAAYYTARGLPTVSEEIMVTAGALHAVHLTLNAKIPGADKAKFDELTAKAKAGCPVSKLLNAKITLDATLS